ncbi:hypothetical protein [Pseudomonas wadenswilerensis]|uniref:hypothetical protein n=1 Tax=Pseudomonas wadenswilerensis TaxID=1785161 RepID=UPI002160A72D|nr:hypothetical protein [Pseudomonas wadenswilerensis]UVM23819.1 hypothetical protein LOY45_09770 [Pseudomonas wadenswilerensis]
MSKKEGKGSLFDYSSSSTGYSMQMPSFTVHTDSTGSAAQSPPQDMQEAVDQYTQAAILSATNRLEALFNEKVVFLNQAEEKVSAMLDRSTSLVKSIEGSLEVSKRLTEKSMQTQDEVQREVKEIKGNSIAALSMFVSFFAFITVSINVFSKAGSVVSASVLVLIFWCLLIGFNILISLQFNVLKNTGVAWFTLVLVAAVSASSIMVMYYAAPDLLLAKTSHALLDGAK